MKKTLFISIAIVVVGLLVFQACNNEATIEEGTEKIENTLVSVSYFKDTLNLAPVDLKQGFAEFNKSIAEIGYPDAGYRIWIVQDDSSEIEYMVMGNWPDQAAYNEIHEHELYKKASQEMQATFNGLVWVDYHRFKTIE